MERTSKRRIRLAFTLVAAISIGLLLVYHFTAAIVSARIQAALGPRATMGPIHVGLRTVEVEDLRVAAPQGWPAGDVLEARKVTLEPVLRSLFAAGPLQIARVKIDDAVLTCLRQPGGRVRILPELAVLNSEAANPSKAATITIDVLQVERARVEIYDATVRTPPYQIVFEPVEATFQNIQLPRREGRITFQVRGLGPRAGSQGQTGAVDAGGWIDPAPGDSEIATHVRGAPLVALEPYLIKATEAGVRSGTLDLDLAADVHQGHLDAPGTLTLNHLELKPSDRGLATFMGVSRELVLKGMENSHGEIQIRFTLDGNLADPQFSLNEGIAMRASAGLAEALGVSVSTVAKSVGSVGGSGASLAGKVVQGAGDVVNQFLGK